ncbi:DUF6265 family protein [Fimbriimonas ginsengisoli]|uniref:DUF6265 domain-containing protein n=1 Tax=Fimbriimonas ginsengisoli Gsoil 348 TaxID=661478 RepID=A0A068NV43_FIMGI|nr:DUF6265 family protein [Fimbriimonas ginsengisoli]AIE87321.1 hypothetical protein OP10G_3953 [Fimbriimonas ginsengisoli Gsoil 348]
MLSYFLGSVIAATLMLCSQVPDSRPISKESERAIDADLSEFAWLAGDWKSDGPGNEYEELWLPAKGGSMVGIFRLIVDGKLASISALNLQQDGKKVKMRLRGLTPELNPAGEKPAVMVLVAKSKGSADFVNQFEGAQPHALHVTSPGGRLHVAVESVKDGVPSQFELKFRRHRS